MHTPVHTRSVRFLWVARIHYDNMVMHENQNKIKSIKVHWHNNRSKNAFTSKYALKMMECPTSRENKKRKRNIHNASTLDISEVDIIVYDFILTKVGRQRKPTVDIVKEKCELDLQTTRFTNSLQGLSNQRRTRSRTHNWSHNIWFQMKRKTMLWLVHLKTRKMSHHWYIYSCDSQEMSDDSHANNS